MICSRNEIVALLYKAAVGSEITVGLAQDLAAAGAWLCSRGEPGVAMTLDAFDKNITSWCAALDLLASGVRSEVVVLAPVDPKIIGALAHMAGANYELRYSIVPHVEDSVLISCKPAIAAAITESGAIDVDLADIQRAETLSHRTYVPASAASRLSGAGAGLTDND
jgi:hypothetical protein